MLSMMPGTATVSMDEWAYTLFEVNKPSPDSKSVRRYRHIQVVRGEGLAEYVQDMGLASGYDEEFNIPGGFLDQGKFYPEHTVGELIDISEQLHKRPYDMGNVMETRTDLVGGYHDQIDRKATANMGRKVFGPRR